MLFTDHATTARPETPPLAEQPLAARMRPRGFDEYCGQDHLIAPGRLLRRAIDADQFSAIILSGPPGTGKTTLAELIASKTASHFEPLSAVVATVADLRRCIKEASARRRLRSGLRTVMFIDELHRFNRAQQDVLLPHVENGTVRLIGATTENPFFCVVGPLLSRSQVFQLAALDEEAIARLLRSCCSDERAFPNHTIGCDDAALEFLAAASEGDARRALGAFELAVLSTEADAARVTTITAEIAAESVQRKPITYGADGHYDTASAFIKSMRASDPDAAIYWLAKMLEAGEDLRFIARRIVIFASEDIGNADPRALTIATDTMTAVEKIGMPEARIVLSQAVTFCATCPKSNASIRAIDSALHDIRNERTQQVPAHLRDAHYAGADKLGHGKGYQYDHNSPDGFSGQSCIGSQKRYYEPVDAGYERQIRERMTYWDSVRRRQGGE